MAKYVIALLIGCTLGSDWGFGAAYRGVVTEVTSDSVTIDGPKGILTCRLSDELLTDTNDLIVPEAALQITRLKKGDQVSLEVVGQREDPVCIRFRIINSRPNTEPRKDKAK